MKILGFMCFDYDSRKQAFSLDAVRIHAIFVENYTIQSSLQHETDLNLLSASLLVLNGLTTDDDWKRNIYYCLLGDGRAIDYIMTLIDIEHTAVRLNAVKLISNITVLPVTRRMFLSNKPFLDQLTNLSKDSNTTIAKHSSIALKAIHWKP